MVSGATLLAIANWATFAATTVKRALAVLGGTACILFIFVPAWGGFPLLLPEMTVRSLGLGALHLGHVTIAGKQCSGLAPYGVRCTDKDSPIQLVNVNLLTRIGSTVLLELPVAVTQDPKNFRKSADRKLFVVKSTDQKRVDNGCDANLLARLKESTEATLPPFQLGIQCIQLVIPRDDVLTYSLNGARTYKKGTSALANTY